MTGVSVDGPPGAVLSDSQIIQSVQSKEIIIQPFDIRLVRGGSVCLRLGTKYMHLNCSEEVDVRLKDSYPRYHLSEVDSANGFEIPRKTIVLADTLEQVALPRGVIGWLSNLSGLARLGLQVVLSN